MLTIVIVGGYGEFGGRIARLLIRDGHIVYIAGRNLEKAEAFADLYGAKALYFDRFGELDSLSALGLDVLIDAAGPFQNYRNNQDAYALARWCVNTGLHYLDLSDDGEFAEGISCLNGEAEEARCVLLSGVSSTPGLSSAVVQKLSDGYKSLSVIETTILPGSRAPRGESVMSAILGQVGNPMRVWRGNRWTNGKGSARNE